MFPLPGSWGATVWTPSTSCKQFCPNTLRSLAFGTALRIAVTSLEIRSAAPGALLRIHQAPICTRTRLIVADSQARLGANVPVQRSMDHLWGRDTHSVSQVQASFRALHHQCVASHLYVQRLISIATPAPKVAWVSKNRHAQCTRHLTVQKARRDSEHPLKFASFCKMAFMSFIFSI